MNKIKLKVSHHLRISFFTLFAFLSSNISYSQDFGADIVSSYVWRGTQFGSGAHIQPYMTLESGNLEGGIWGSFPTSAKGGGNELDAYLSYDFGPLALTLTNYTFPGEGGKYTKGEGFFEGDYMEISGSTSIFGFDIMTGYFTEQEALYIELGFDAGPVNVAIGYGNDQGDSWYANGGSGLVNMSFSGSKEITLSESYSLPVFGSFIVNPEAETAFLVFGISF